RRDRGGSRCLRAELLRSRLRPALRPHRERNAGTADGDDVDQRLARTPGRRGAIFSGAGALIDGSRPPHPALSPNGERDLRMRSSRGSCRLGYGKAAGMLGAFHQESMFEFRRGDGGTEVVPLSFLAPHRFQQIGRRRTFDSLGNDPQTQPLAQTYRVADDGSVVRIRPQFTHKGAVDFEPVEREFLQIGEARITGAEVVEYDVNAQLLDPTKRLGRDVVILEQDVFRYLKLEQSRRKSCALEHPLDCRRKIARLNLRRGEIDAEADVMPLLLPQATLPTSGFKDPERGAARNRGSMHERHEIG